MIVLVLVLYRSYDDLDALLGAQSGVFPSNLSVVIVDNTERGERREERLEAWSKLAGVYIVTPVENAGYFGAVREAQSIKPELFSSAEFVIVANVDLSFSFSKIVHALNGMHSSLRNVGVIAPLLVGQNGQQVRQLHYFQKPEASRYRHLAQIFSNYPLAIAHRLAADIKRGLLPEKVQLVPMGPIFAPHGAMMIFTAEYLDKTDGFAHPTFLFCEEIYVGHQCEINGLICITTDCIHYSHRNHGSIGRIPSHRIIGMLRDSHLAAVEMLMP